MKDKIRIGVLVKSTEILLWENRVLQRLINSGFAEVKLLIKMDEDPDIIKNNKYSAIYRFHESLDRYFYRNGFNYLQKINILDSCKDIPLISYNRAQEYSGDNLAGLTGEKIIDYNLDIILNFGSVSLSNELLKVPRYGIWSYNIGDGRIISSIPPVYWEIVKKKPEIGCTVNMLRTDKERSTVIYQASTSTFTRSININKNRIYGLASLIIPRLVKGLFESGSSYLENSTGKFKCDAEIYNLKLYKSPGSLSALRNLAIIFTANLYRNLLYTKKDYWYLLFKINQNNNPFPAVIDSFSRLAAPKGKFWADPFVVTKDGNHYIFVEEYLFKAKRAHISVLKLDARGCLLTSEKIIEKPYHISYPFIFKLNDKHYMIPESKENRTIQLYCCTDFPSKWEFVMNLMENIDAVDSTLFYYNGKWWLFTAIDELKDPSIPFSELFLYFSDDLFSGRWQSHPKNPIVTDINISRPAGRIFTLDNRLFRPSQDCSGGYGKAFNLCQIIKLSEDAYEEILIRKVEPDWDRNLTGTHTFNFDENITVIDASPRRKRIRLGLFIN